MPSAITKLCKELRIGDLQAISLQVPFQDPEQFLTSILEHALDQRQQKRVEGLVKQARFPAMNMRLPYTFDRITFPQSINQEQLLHLEFLDRLENVCFFGPCGTGKTRLAMMLGLRACHRGDSVQFYRVIDLVNSLLDGYENGRAKALLDRIAKSRILILDEIGFIPFTKRGAEMLFAVISQGYETQVIITTSNLEFGRWNEVFGDDRLTTAIIDRIVHRSHILSFSGPSRRLEEAMAMRGPTPELKMEDAKEESSLGVTSP